MIRWLLFFLLNFALLSTSMLHGQQRIPSNTDSLSIPPSDSTKPVEILHADRLTLQKKDSLDLQILVGKVQLQQGTALFYCDSCVLNQTGNTFEAWGAVRLLDADTTDVKAQHLRYLIAERIAYLDGNVRLSDGKGSLQTPDLEYNMNSDIGIYRHGGKVNNGKTILTSLEGYYYAGLRDIYFIKQVKLQDPAYQISTDSLLYNMDSRITRFVAQTEIRDSTGRTVETRDGFYDMSNGKAEFGKRPVIRDGKTRITGESIRFDDKSGISDAQGNVVIIDSAQGTTLMAGRVVRDNKKKTVLSTEHPVLVVEQDKDSVYITADTLFSGPIPPGLDSFNISKNIQTDSTLRFFQAYRRVRIFTDSLQAVCDSLFYSYQDSAFRLFQDPIIWSRGSQITGDTVILRTKNKKAERLDIFEHSLLVQRLDPEVYNQVKSIRMTGFLTAGVMDSLQAKGYAECLYFIQDDDSAYSGVNESKSDRMDIYFFKGELDRVVFRSEVSGTVWPIREKNPASMRLSGFQWLDELRPKSRFAILRTTD